VAEMMNELEQLKTLLKIDLNDESEDDLLLMLLTLSAQRILEKAYPYDDSITEVPERYKTKQVEIAVYLYNKQGAEGQIAHSENNVSRTYESADIPEGLLRGITPYVGVIQ